MNRDRAAFLLVSACYQAFTLSDGALRMLVLLHLHELGRSPFALALVLLPYEVAGVFTNLLGASLSTRYGNRVVLVAGLLLQALACAMLCASDDWLTPFWLAITQVASGVAKDLAKTSAKSFVRVLAPDGPVDGLFRAVGFLTGSKNAMKGLGYFAGGALLALVGFRATNALIAVVLVVVALAAVRLLPDRGRKRAKSGLSVLRQDAAVRWLALARMFLFGSRDVWFAIALPLFLATELGLGSAQTGALLSLWIVGYGVVQAMAPAALGRTDVAAGTRRTARFTALLLVPLLATAAALELGGWPLPTVLTGIFAYGVVFAVCSSLHSWLVVAMGRGDDAVERVGFYYAANSVGRVLGLLASGLVHGAAGGGQDGFVACVLVAAVTVALATAASWRMARCSAAITSP